MKLEKYLKYNGIPLIDITFEFHRSCAEFYNNKGYLTVNQIASLKKHVHSPEAIARLLERNAEPSNPMDQPKQKKKKPKTKMPPKPDSIDSDEDKLPF